MKKSKILKVVFATLFCVALILIGIYFLLQRQTYNTVETVEYYENVSLDNPGYESYLKGVLKYTRDGIALLDKNGGEVWNQPCQMNNPVVEVRGEIAVVCDRSGTSILVFEESGLKGEIKTTRPIERISVSEQGIVAAILKDDATPKVVCYDAAGNILVEQNASLENTGYPIDVALSADGNTLLVSYLMADGVGVRTKIVYYDFSGEDIEKKDFKIYEHVYEDKVIPVVGYMNANTSVLAADNQVIIYEGKEELQEAAKIPVYEISNITYDEKNIVLLMREENSSTYKLKVYSAAGEVISEIEVEREYSNIKVFDNQIILYEENTCAIYTKDGLCKYKGEMDTNILEIYPMMGINKYMMINANGFYEIRLAKLGE